MSVCSGNALPKAVVEGVIQIEDHGSDDCAGAGSHIVARLPLSWECGKRMGERFQYTANQRRLPLVLILLAERVVWCSEGEEGK